MHFNGATCVNRGLGDLLDINMNTTFLHFVDWSVNDSKLSGALLINFAKFNIKIMLTMKSWHLYFNLQVNQKMMKSTLIKDLYGEIERLKAGKLLWSLVRRVSIVMLFWKNFILSYIPPPPPPHTEVYAAREKNGVYIPKERYYQEEAERKVLHLVYSAFHKMNSYSNSLNSSDMLTLLFIKTKSYYWLHFQFFCFLWDILLYVLRYSTISIWNVFYHTHLSILGNGWSDWTNGNDNWKPSEG